MLHCSASFSTFPNEVLAWIFQYLSSHELATISLLCRTWRVLAFPQLYKHIYVLRRSHLESLAAQIVLNTGSGPLSISAHTKSISISNYTSKTDKIVEASLVQLETIVPRLTQLKSLYWNLDFLPRDPKYLQLFEIHCPGLERLEHALLFAQIHRSETDRYTRVFDFTNLSYIKLTLPGISFTLTDSRVDYRSHMTRLLTSCPNLISLELENATLDPISAKNIVDSLGNRIVFPFLRVFQIRGGGQEFAHDDDDVDWDSFFTPPGCYSHPLRMFFSRHQVIEDLALGWLSSWAYEGKIDPNEMSQLFPSLKHLEGPAFLCSAIIKSNVGQKIESLVVNNVWAGKKDWIADLVIGLREMPKLLRLQLFSEDPEDVIDPLALDNLLRITPLLEMLDFRVGVNNFPAVVLAISHVPNLRHLIVEGEAWIAAALSREQKTDSNHEDWVFTISTVAKHCRRLVRFESCEGYAGKMDWKIRRDPNGMFVDVVAIG